MVANSTARQSCALIRILIEAAKRMQNLILNLNVKKEHLNVNMEHAPTQEAGFINHVALPPLT